MPTLVAGEADRIQDLIFRSSRLREITGGSFALEEFWKGAATSAEDRGARVLVSAGGTFRVVFDDPGTGSDAFARDLQDAYAREIGGVLTTVSVTGEGGDGELLKQAAVRLAREKLRGDPPAASVHLPYLQPCSSCARDLAAERIPVGGGEHEDLCRICARRRGERDRFKDAFLDRVKRAGGDGGVTLGALADLPDDANQVGRLDGRARVAYLLADGNGFGRYFGEAARDPDPEVYPDLSRTVSAAGAEALAAATASLTARIPPLADGTVPVLPLITGGDDIFALLPAPWAFDFAREFAAAFVARMRRARLFTARGDLAPSISCALVLCKATFPYRFAHQAGEDALKEAKRTARAHPGVSVVRGTELRATLAGEGTGPVGEYGVFALDVPGAPTTSLLPLATLLSVRGALKPRMAGKRRHQIEALYAAEDRATTEWEGRRARILARMEGGDDAEAALARLVSGADDGERSAVIDLLHMWDYLRELTPAAIAGTR